MSNLFYIVTIVGLLLVFVGLLAMWSSSSPSLAYISTFISGLGILMLVFQSFGRLLGY